MTNLKFNAGRSVKDRLSEHSEQSRKMDLMVKRTLNTLKAIEFEWFRQILLIEWKRGESMLKKIKFIGPKVLR